MPEASERLKRRRGKRRGLFARFLNAVEFLGNLLPHPVTLFAALSVIVLLVSGWRRCSTCRSSTRGPPARPAARRTG